MVFVTRLRRGASPFRGDVDHTSHRLIAAGIGPVGMLVALSAVAALVGAVAVGLAAWAGDFRLVAVAVAGLALAVAGFEALVAWRLPYGRDRSPSPDTDSDTADGPAILATPAERADVGQVPGATVGRRAP